MRNVIWIKGCVIGIITLFIGTSVLPNISGNFLEENNAWNENLKTDERNINVSLKTGSIEPIKQSQIKSLYLNNEIPMWKIGDSWIYELSIFFKLEESDSEISIDLSTNNLYFEVIDESGGSYHLKLNGDISGDFVFNVQGSPDIKGSLKNTGIVGTASIEQATLGIEELDLQIDGRLSLLGLIPISIDITLVISFDPSYHSISFPLEVGNEWFVNSSSVKIEGKIDMPGISQLFSSIPDEIPIDISDYAVGGNQARCIGKESVEVVAGEYTAYNISFDDRIIVYFADAAGNFISIVPSLDNGDLFELEFNFELVSTTYIDPEAPNVPSTPIGPKKGNLKTEHTYSSSATDPQGDQIYYLFDWDDGSNSGWLGPYNSSVICDATHKWSEKGYYGIKVKAKDVSGKESGWSDPLPVKMPYSYNPILQFLELLFQRFPNAFPLLRQLFGY